MPSVINAINYVVILEKNFRNLSEHRTQCTNCFDEHDISFDSLLLPNPVFGNFRIQL